MVNVAALEIAAHTAGASVEELEAQKPFVYDMYQNQEPLCFYVIERQVMRAHSVSPCAVWRLQG